MWPRPQNTDRHGDVAGVRKGPFPTPSWDRSISTIPPQTDTEPFARHARLDSVGCLGWCVVCLRRAGRRLVMPLLVNDLEAHHLMCIVEEAFLVEAPDPKLLAVITRWGEKKKEKSADEHDYDLRGTTRGQ